MTGQQATNARLLRLAALASVSVATILIGVKFVAWSLTGSTSLLASLVDSMMDLAASGINFMAIRYALKGADHEHRFGHGKAESLAGMAQASFIAGSAVFLLIYAGNRLLEPRPLENIDSGLAVMLFSLLLTMALVGFQRHVIKRTGSVAIRADSLHYVTDILTILVTIAALFLVRQGLLWADPLLALGIACYILYSAALIIRESLRHLMDQELSPEIKGQIRTIVLNDQRVLGMHDLRTRQAGQTKFIQFHLDLSAELSLREAHAIGQEIAETLKQNIPGADITVHQDPIKRHSPLNNSHTR
ncbi:cation diffusion facilitator family transporter [Desulfurivibrio alkaliphilus]|uniref:Cation-efflux pump FieF n=1 Tax=Desulfurivibrio alkaliphilus (strain DSM 19089 / UNIQEM U267 / AHT2) TaxID=589865 RepID=D6Z5C3_DESAT|nr:cation diffusion facilitator family transporter [Desulfurivibrio alkaliphilus]ADH84780.1 cation diffusion facilitator family transporter [Desulfurivibrio alkaliphilus AHT 2]